MANKILLLNKAFTNISKQNNIEQNYKEYQLLSNNIIKKLNVFDNNISNLCDIFNTMLQSKFPKAKFIITKEVLSQNAHKYNFYEWQSLYKSFEILLNDIDIRISILENKNRKWYIIQRIEIYNYGSYYDFRDRIDHKTTKYHSDSSTDPNPIIINFLPTDEINKYYRVLDNITLNLPRISNGNIIIKIIANKDYIIGK